MKCLKCQTENPPGSKFCEACGSKIEAAAVPPSGFCPSCGASVKPGSKFCPGCGASQVAGAPASGPSAPPQASYPPPPPGPGFHSAPLPSPSPTYNAGQRIGGGAPPVKKSGGCCGGCAVVAAITLLLLAVGGWFLYNNVVLGNPLVLTGPWKAVKGKSAMAGESFVFEPVDGGVKMLPGDGRKSPFDIILKPAGTKRFQTKVTNPDDSSQWADIKVEVLDLNKIKINFELSDGEKDEVEATRDVSSVK